MKKWMKPAMEVVEVDMNDVIATSLNNQELGFQAQGLEENGNGNQIEIIWNN